MPFWRPPLPLAPQGNRSPTANFLEVDPAVKWEVMEKLAHSWDLVLAVTSSCPKLSKHHLVVAEV